MKNPFAGFGRARDKPEDRVSNAPTFNYGTSTSGKAVTVNSAIQTSTVYACVRVIAETIAGLPFQMLKATNNEVEKATEHPLYRILHDEPNTEMTSFTWRETFITHLLLYGNSYNQIIRNGRGQVVQLYPLLPDNMTVDRDEKTGKLTYTYQTTSGERVILRPEQVLHIPGLGFDGVIGYSPIAMCKNAVGLGIAAEEYGSKFFSNGARPAGILSHPNQIKDPAALRESWNAAYGGSINSGKVAVLEEGMQFHPISIPNNEAQFLETRKFQVSEICRIYRVPPHLIGELEHATFSNIEHQNISFAVHTIAPWLARIEQAINRSLLSDKEKGKYYAHFNIDGLMRGDYKSRMEGYAIARQNGWMNTNDIRKLENMNLVPDEEGGNAYLINGNMVPLTYSLAMLDKINIEILKTLVEASNAAQPAEPTEQPDEQQDNPPNEEQPQEDEGGNPPPEEQPEEKEPTEEKESGKAKKK